MPERTALYRLYDADGRLLYVGISANPEQRWKGHEVYSGRWWALVTEKVIEWHADRELALAHEFLAIWREAPAHNRRRTPPNTSNWSNEQAAELLDNLPEGVRPYSRLVDSSPGNR
ncbi:GIY-YIG nuclease family protein [Streptomyces sp. NPDC059447]|uniref:GIY-YIG nuclease family protein n=1 Tax=Streptomyces sp. NPDC059447 TaxID=3346834 RepID=UPI0036B6BF18